MHSDLRDRAGAGGKATSQRAWARGLAAQHNKETWRMTESSWGCYGASVTSFLLLPATKRISEAADGLKLALASKGLLISPSLFKSPIADSVLQKSEAGSYSLSPGIAQ